MSQFLQMMKATFNFVSETVAVEYLLWGGVILIEVFNSIKFVFYLFKVGQN